MTATQIGVYFVSPHLKALAAYYLICRRSDYFDSLGRGKFMKFVETVGMDEGNIRLELGLGVSPDDCVFIDIDDNFPVRKEFDTGDGRKTAIFKVIQRCYRFGKYGILSCYRHIDWRLYFNDREDRCSLMEDGQCSAVDRMINALKYYSKIEVVQNESDRREFVEFLQETYIHFLIDYVHITTMHIDPDHVDRIQATKTKEFVLINKCDRFNCLCLYVPATERKHQFVHSQYLHCPPVNGEHVLFYRDLMDAMHCYLVHSFDIGIRIRLNERKCRDPELDVLMRESENPTYSYVNTLKTKKNRVYVFANPLSVTRGE